MTDGVRLAVDVWAPARQNGTQVPAVVQMTRYQRSHPIDSGKLEDDDNYQTAMMWNRAGYAYVAIDARGSGASFGTRRGELSDREIRDYDEMLSWIATQAWSDGHLGAYGTSYSGDTAELVVRLHNPHLRAVGLLFDDFDVYEGVIAPGGLVNLPFAAQWPLLNDALDGIPGARDALAAYLQVPASTLQIPRPKPVDGADGTTLLNAAVAEHAGNVRLLPDLLHVEFRDDEYESGVGTLDSISPFSYQQAIESSGVPMFVLASWLDAGSGQGAVNRFNTFSNTQEVHIGSWSHGGREDADPFNESNAPASPSAQQQMDLLVSFFDKYVKQAQAPDNSKTLQYSTLGDTQLHTTAQWPPANTQTRTLYIGDARELSSAPTSGAERSDVYTVDATATSGSNTNRWATQLGTDVVYPDRAAEDNKLLVYETAALSDDLIIDGAPVVHLWLSSTDLDPAVIAYLEAVAPDGHVTYLTEGQLRLINRESIQFDFPHRAGSVPRSFMRADAQQLVPGEINDVSFDLLSTSARLKAGYKLRIAIAGADAGTFPLVGIDSGQPQVLTIYRSAAHDSRIDIPVSAGQATF
jgi:putative CocE/NonD family hydrolase